MMLCMFADASTDLLADLWRMVGSVVDVHRIII